MEDIVSNVKFYYSTLQSIWHKAETLLENEEMIVAAPGMHGAYFVKSSSKEFTKSFIKKKGKQTPNLGEFALTGMPAGRNRKGGVPPRKRRSKGNSSLLPHIPLSQHQHG